MLIKARDQSQQLSPARSPVTLILTLQVICESFLSVAFIVSVEVEQMLKRKWNLFHTEHEISEREDIGDEVEPRLTVDVPGSRSKSIFSKWRRLRMCS